MIQKLSLFPDMDNRRQLGELSIPEHTMEALDSYFLRGWEPGSFLKGILTNNLYAAVNSADTANRHAIWEIVKWLTTERLPSQSFGNVEYVRHYLNDTDGIRTKFVEKIEKEYIWETLKG
jgi:hypothetical protein